MPRKPLNIVDGCEPDAVRSTAPVSIRLRLSLFLAVSGSSESVPDLGNFQSIVQVPDEA
jgi:hypothetical protein